MKSNKSKKQNCRDGITTRRMSKLKQEKKAKNTPENDENRSHNFERITTRNSKISITREESVRNVEVKHFQNFGRMTTRSVKKNDVPASIVQQENKNTVVASTNVDSFEKKKASNKHEIAEIGDNYDVFLTGDIVWAKLKGHPYWPAKVSLRFIFTQNFNVRMVVC